MLFFIVEDFKLKFNFKLCFLNYKIDSCLLIKKLLEN